MQMNQLCKVCGEPAAGFHFGAFTCEGCKVDLLTLNGLFFFFFFSSSQCCETESCCSSTKVHHVEAEKRNNYHR